MLLRKRGISKGGLYMRATALLCGALVLVCAVAISAEAVKSGLQAGESVPAFQVDDVTGPNKGTQLCYV